MRKFPYNYSIMDKSYVYRVVLVLAMLTLGLNNSVLAQNTMKAQVDELMETAIAQMNEGEYEQANLTFRKILKIDAVLPDEMSYLFAETLYMVDQNYNSRSFLDKYIRLVGTTGRYYSQAMDLKHYLDQEYELILECRTCDSRGYKLKDCHHCDSKGKLTDQCFYCRGVGINLCDLCKGQGVTTSYSAFGERKYQTCNNCQGKSQTVCKVCQGEKLVYEDCQVCHGTGQTAGTEICDHPEELDTKAVKNSDKEIIELLEHSNAEALDNLSNQ